VGQQDSVARGPLGRAGVARRVTASSSSEQRTSGSVDQAKLSSASRFDSRIDYLIYSHSVLLYLYYHLVVFYSNVYFSADHRRTSLSTVLDFDGICAFKRLLGS
jgi:hypothetical protein